MYLHLHSYLTARSLCAKYNIRTETDCSKCTTGMCSWTGTIQAVYKRFADIVPMLITLYNMYFYKTAADPRNYFIDIF